MTTVDIPDLLQVPPYRRDEIRRRVAVVERYLANQSGPAATAAAKELGMGQTAFYMLVKAWRERNSAIHLPGAGAPRAEHHGLSRNRRDRHGRCGDAGDDHRTCRRAGR